jgi:hypothetical protein
MTTDDATHDYTPTRYERFRHEFWLVIARAYLVREEQT